MGRFGAVIGLAGGCVLAAIGVAIAAFRPFAPTLNDALALGAIAIGIVSVAVQVWRLRRGPYGAELLWTSVLDAFLVLAAVLAVLPVAALVRGFVELFVQAHVHTTRDAVAYSCAEQGLEIQLENGIPSDSGRCSEKPTWR